MSEFVTVALRHRENIISNRTLWLIVALVQPFTRL
uniref:Uncharacterized protein n=1 Tax=Arundo donax TaxID=35708 RepID=A0A0A8ZSL2_ARUDO